MTTPTIAIPAGQVDVATVSPAPPVAPAAPPPSSKPPLLVRGLQAFAVTYGLPLMLIPYVGLSLFWLVTGRLFRPPQTLLGWLARPLLVLGAVAPFVYYLFIRPRHLQWGATDEETARSLPGDDVIPNPAYFSNHAVTIHAPAEEVWPWLAQIGQGRGGFYSYDWLENLAGCEMRNADRIYPEWQEVKVGDKIYLHPDLGMDVVEVVPGRAIVLKGWGAFVVEPVDGHTSRLIIRGPVGRGLGDLLIALSIEIPHFIMQRKMMLGLKERAEAAQALDVETTA